MNLIGKEILNYRIISMIGKGGMGAVYLAEHKNISTQKAAIKVINAEMVNDFTRRMLKDEAEHLAGLHHHNIVSFLDFHIDKEGNIYLIMEYAEGESLESYIKNVNGLIVEDRICPMFEPILDGVGYAHKKGILHRDIKPANIVISTDGTPKILDFGIAKIINKNADEESDNLVMGTPSYMSPEQVKGEHLDERSDIYSLGVLLHQMLTGNAPYDTTTLTEQDINQKVVEEPLPRMRTYYKYVSDKVQAVVDKATAKNPDDRYQSCEEFKKALHNAIYPWKPKTWMKFAAAAVLALLIGTGFYVWDYNRTKVKYYKDYVEVWGVPQGVHKLSKNEVEHRTDSYRMEFRQRKLLRMSHINSKGSIIAHHTTDRVDRPADSKYYYTEDGKVDYVEFYDECGKVDMVRDYNRDQTVVIFRYADSLNTEKVLQSETIGTFTSSSKDGGKRSRISRYLLSHDSQGHVIEIKYAGFQNTIVADGDGLYGRKYKYDDKGRVIEEMFINQDGEPTATKYGLGIRTTEYNKEDDPIKFQYLTPEREPAGEKDLEAPVCRNEVDKWGNTIRQYYEDLDGNPVYRRDMNIAVYVMDIENGLNVKQSGLDVDGQPTYFKEGGYASAKLEYDKNGFISKLEVFDIDGNPTLNENGVFRDERINDIHGNIVEAWFYDVEGNLTLYNNNFAGIKAEYDSVGNQTKIVYFGKDRNPCEISDGTCGALYEYNERNLQTSITSLDKSLNPAPDMNNIAIARIDYDKRGNAIKVAFFGSDGTTPCLSREGSAGWFDSYDENGNQTERAFFDTKGSPISPNGLHYAKKKYTYDDNGNMTSEKYYNLQGSLTSVDGIAGREYKYDSRGNLLEDKAIGTDGSLAYNKVIRQYKYDKFNNVIEMSVYNKTGATLNAENVHKYKYLYNSRKQLIEERRYGKDDKLILSSERWAIQKNKYDSKGNLCERRYYGTDEKPCTISEGWSSAAYEYDVFGHIIRQCFFDVNGQPTNPSKMPPVGIAEYDRRGNMIMVAAQDSKGNYILYPNEKWSIRRADYDKRDNQISEAYYDEKNKPVLCSNRYHKKVSCYDSYDRLISEEYMGTANQPIIVNGFHKETYKYSDNSNNVVEDALFDIKGNPVNCDAGFHKVVFTYNEEGTLALTRKYYKANGTILATQRWNGYEWELVQQQFDWREIVSELNRECPYDFGADAMHLTMQYIRATGNRDCEIKFVVPYHTKSQLSSDQLNALKQAVQQITKGVEEQLNHKPYVTGNLYDKNGTSLYSVRI